MCLLKKWRYKNVCRRAHIAGQNFSCNGFGAPPRDLTLSYLVKPLVLTFTYLPVHDLVTGLLLSNIP